jgi:hypothetical protein
VARNWLSITVDLVEGGTRTFWPRPGRILAAARTHTFGDLSDAIDDAFARWDRAHLHEFRLLDGTRIGRPDPDWDDDEAVVDDRRTKLGLGRPTRPIRQAVRWRRRRVADTAEPPTHGPSQVPPALGRGRRPLPRLIPRSPLRSRRPPPQACRDEMSARPTLAHVDGQPGPSSPSLHLAPPGRLELPHTV